MKAGQFRGNFCPGRADKGDNGGDNGVEAVDTNVGDVGVLLGFRSSPSNKSESSARSLRSRIDLI